MSVGESPAKTIEKPVHKPKLGFFIYMMAFGAVIGGLLIGYGMGVVAEAMLYVAKNKDLKPINNFWHELIVSSTVGMAGLSSIVAGTMSDKLGRRKTIMISALIFSIGGIVTAIAFNKWILLIGRMLIGVALGISSMVVPIYVSEAAPASIRGTLGTAFQLLYCIGLLMANIVSASFSYIDPENIGWSNSYRTGPQTLLQAITITLMFGFAAIPSTIQLIWFVFLPESPRVLYEKFGSESSKKVLTRIYNHDEDWVLYELNQIKQTYELEKKEKQEHGGDGFILGRIFTTPHVRKALIIGCSIMFLQVFSGCNIVFYYSGSLIKAAGVKNDHTNMWISCITVGIFLISMFFPLYMIERVGRKKLMIGSMLAMIISQLLLGTSFLVINRKSAKILSITDYSLVDTSVSHYKKCAGYSNCDFCVTNENCGFCAVQSQNSKEGYCFPTSSNQSDIRSSTGYCQSETSSDSDNLHNISGLIYEWDSTYCHSEYNILTLVFMAIFIASFAAGYAPIPWVLTSEFYPLWARSTCVAITTFTNWFSNLLVSLTFLSLTEAITKFGVFYLYSGITIFAVILFMLVVPETKGLNLDEIERLFMDKPTRKSKESN